MLMRKADFIKHLALGKAKHSAITPIIPDPATPIIPDPATPIIPDPATPIIPEGKMQRTHRELFRKVRSTEEVECLSAAASTEDEHSHDEADLGDIPYPPKDVQKLKGMAQYILSHKKLPAVLPEHLRLPSVEVQYSRHLIPEERMCQHCPGNVPLSDPVLITHEAKILTKSRIVNGPYCSEQSGGVFGIDFRRTVPLS
ncbi:hypothetical protein NQZ68_032665 [Dissostichus eleginoides]|nr:hypothetical protein NQZ68_032665 [Dissostichus eleginoides]